MSGSAKDITQPRITTASLDCEFEEAVKGVLFFGPEIQSHRPGAGPFRQLEGIIENRTATANRAELPSISRDYDVETSERTLVLSVS